jgi:hypothetical protein
VKVALLQASTLAGLQTMLPAPGMSQMKRKFFEVLADAVLGAALSLGWSLSTLAQGDRLYRKAGPAETAFYFVHPLVFCHLPKIELDGIPC